MEQHNNSKLLPSDEEIAKFLTQMALYAPSQVPVAVCKVFFAKMMAKQIDQLKIELNRQVEELMNNLNQ
jgi:hypothetical protein